MAKVCETKDLAEWSKGTAADDAAGIRMILRHKAAVKSLAWHRKGDYFAVPLCLATCMFANQCLLFVQVCTPDAPGAPVLVHQLSKRRSQAVIKKNKGSKVLCHLA